MKYQKKPVIVEAVQYTGTNESAREIERFVNDYSTLNYDEVANKYYVKTLEGQLYVDIGDYIIKGIKGEFYPCKPDIFKETYERVEVEADESI